MDRQLEHFSLYPIGVIHSPYAEDGDAPRQGALSDKESTIEIFPEYAAGLLHIERCEKIVVIYWGHRADRAKLQTTTFFSDELTGVFACRAPNRPNPLALCIAKVVRREGNSLVVIGLDAFSGSPVLDVKVHSPGLDNPGEAKAKKPRKDRKPGEHEPD